MSRHATPRVLFATQAALALAAGAAVTLAAGPAEGLVAFAVIAVMALGLQLLRGRSETADVLSGVGDERVRTLSLQAAAWTAYVMALVLIVWWLVSIALGDNNETINQVCAMFGVVWVACAVLARARS